MEKTEEEKNRTNFKDCAIHKIMVKIRLTPTVVRRRPLNAYFWKIFMCETERFKIRNKKKTSKTIPISLLFCKIFLFFFAAPAIKAFVENHLVGKTHKEGISHEDVLNRIHFILLSSGRPFMPELVQQLYNQVLNQLIDEALQRQLIKKYKISVSDEEVNEQIRVMEKQNRMAEGEFWKFFEKNGIPKETFLNQLKTQMGWVRYIQALYGNQVNISEKDIQRAKKRWKKEHTGTMYRIGEIVFYVRPSDDPMMIERRAQHVFSLLKQGAPFMRLAQQFSQAPSGARGGISSWILLRQIDSDMHEVVQNAPEGEVLPPMLLPSTANPKKAVILVVLEKKSVDELNLKMPSDEKISAELRNEILERCSRKELENLRQNSHHEIAHDSKK